MKTIVLKRHGAYAYKNVAFSRGVPMTVEDEIANYLLGLGYFSCVDAAEFFETAASVQQPLNTLQAACDLPTARVLLKRNGAIGDVVFVAQLAAWLKQAYPGIYVAAAVRDTQTEWLSGFDCFDAVYTLEEAAKTDLVFSFQYIILLNGVIEEKLEDTRDYATCHWERAGLPLPPPATLPLVSVTRAAATAAFSDARAFLRTIGFGEAPYIVLLLGTSRPVKQLHPAAIGRLAAALACPGGAEDERYRVLCLGGPRDRLIQQAPETSWIVTRTDLPLATSAELVRRANAVVGADTGLLHYAAAIGVPTVSLWGPTDSNLTIPRYTGSHEVVRSVLPCAPCRRIRTASCSKFDGSYAECMLSFDAVSIAPLVRKAAAAGCSHPARALMHTQYDPSAYNAAVLLDRSDSYSGGGFYTWNLAYVLAKLGNADVWVYADKSVVYANDDVLPTNLHVIPNTDLASWDGDGKSFAFVIGTPMETGTTAVRYAAAHDGTKAFVTLYETPNYIGRYRTGRDAEDAFWAEFVENALLPADAILTISSEVKKALFEWLPQLKEAQQVVEVLSPTINDAHVSSNVEELLSTPREDRIVLIARNMRYKRLAGTIHHIFSTFHPGRAYHVDVVGANTAKLSSVLIPPSGVTIAFHERLAEHEKWKLLETAKAYVHSSEFEGFGIPLAEALFACTPTLAHPLPVFQSCFREYPYYYEDNTGLTLGLQEIFSQWDQRDAVFLQRLTLGRTKVAQAYTRVPAFSHFARFLGRRFPEYTLNRDARAANAARSSRTDGVRVALVTPWGNRCGIAETTREIAANLQCLYRIFAPDHDALVVEDDANVVRCWGRKFDRTLSLLNALVEFAPDIVHFEHEFSLFKTEHNLFALSRALRERGIKTLLTLHTFRACSFIDEASVAFDHVILTKKQAEAPPNSTVVALPVTKSHAPVEPLFSVPAGTPVVGAFGMWKSHKGFVEFLDTYNEVAARVGDNLVYVVIGSMSMREAYATLARHKFAHLVEARRVIFVTDYAPMAAVYASLRQCAALVFNYNVVGHSSSSAAVRTGMATGRPVICTESPMFSEITHESTALKVPFGDAAALASAITRLLQDTAFGKEMADRARKAFVDPCGPAQIARAHEAVYRKLLGADQ